MAAPFSLWVALDILFVSVAAVLVVYVEVLCIIVKYEASAVYLGVVTRSTFITNSFIKDHILFSSTMF